MRLFVSLELPEMVIQEAIRVQKEFRAQELFEGTFVAPENMHITLFFFGSVADEGVPQIAHTLGTISYPSFEVHLGELTVNSYAHPHVLWISVEGMLLRPFAHLLEENFPEQKQEREFNAHITLARIKKLRHKQRLKEAISRITLTHYDWPITHFTLEQSETFPEGPVYTTLATYQLL